MIQVPEVIHSAVINPVDNPGIQQVLSIVFNALHDMCLCVISSTFLKVFIVSSGIETDSAAKARPAFEPTNEDRDHARRGSATIE